MQTRYVGRLVLGLLVLGLAGCTDRQRELTAPEPVARTTAASEATATGAVVVFTSETAIPSAGIDLVTRLGGTITSRHDPIGVLFATGLSALALNTLRASDVVADAGPDYLLNWLPGLRIGEVVGLEDGAGPNTHDPARASRLNDWQWGPQRIAADRAWQAGFFGSPDIRVAILDTGIDVLHRELRGLVDLDRSAAFVETEPTFDDLHFHGTHVASSVVTNSVTIAGVAPHVTLIAVKVLSAMGSGTFEGVINGIMHAADVGSHVINMSLGAQFDRRLEGARALIQAMHRAIQHAEKQGTIVISAAGNSATNLDDAGAPIVALPCMVSTLCVAATGPLNGGFDENGPILTDNHDQPAWYTNYGLSAIDVAAPGGNFNPDDPDQETWVVEDMIAGACAGRATQVPVCAINNDVVAFYVFAAGTSMAAPHVSGAAALVQAQAGGGLSVEALRERLTAFADDVGDPGPDPFSGHGRINVLRSITQN